MIGVVFLIYALQTNLTIYIYEAFISKRWYNDKVLSQQLCYDKLRTIPLQIYI
jgi:hypothetical protein